jgi:hypothetical protein
LKKYKLDFLQILQKTIAIYGLQPPVFSKVKFCFVLKWRLCSKQPQKFSFLFIIQSTLKNFMISLLILVNGQIPHKSWKKSLLAGSKWRLKFKMTTYFQSAVTLVLIKFFSKFLLNFACVENREKLWKNFFSILAQDGATCPRGWPKIVFLP